MPLLLHSALLYMCVAVAGYAALGDVVPGDILQGFSHPRSLVSIASCAVLVHMAMAYQVGVGPTLWALRGHDLFILLTVDE